MRKHQTNKTAKGRSTRKRNKDNKYSKNEERKGNTRARGKSN
jgi:hypothetical protein